MVEILPHLNATLNVTSGILLLAGWRYIRARRVRSHRACMISAFACSILFLASYLTRLALCGHHPYPGTGWDREFYLVLLASHVILAALVPGLACRTLYLAWRRRLSSHRRWARVTLPVWLYVSVTGVAVYVMLYHPALVQ
ncbi:MAG: DUF420 domain-containing protein [Myxococcota bacterium]